MHELEVDEMTKMTAGGGSQRWLIDKSTPEKKNCKHMLHAANIREKFYSVKRDQTSP